MENDPLDYQSLILESLRHVARRSLEIVARQGLPGKHHFFIAFDTTAPGVRLSEILRGQYPEEMTIVLRHQFQDLEVWDEAFAVTLRFNGVPHRMTIPFAALLSFVDPSVQLALGFVPPAEDAEDESEPEPPAAEAATPFARRSDAEPAKEPPQERPGEVVSFGDFRRKDPA